jgi:hypothetical protein
MAQLVGDPLAFLTARLGLFRPEAGSAFFFEPTPGFYGFIAQGSVEDLTGALRMLAEHIECPTTPRVQKWKGSANTLAASDHDWAADQGPAGSIRYAGTHSGSIEISSTHRHSSFILGATLAHELAHHYLAHRGVRLPAVDENERLTDVATIFLGLGKLTLNGYEPQTWSVRKSDGTVTTYTSRIGYLSQEALASAAIRVCDLRSLPLDLTLPNLSPTAARLLQGERQRALSSARRERMRLAFRRMFRWPRREPAVGDHPRSPPESIPLSCHLA